MCLSIEIFKNPFFLNFIMEENMDFKDYETGIKKVTIELPIDIWMKAKQNLLEFKNTLIFGINFKLAEKDGGLTFDYPPTNLHNKFLKKCHFLESALQEANEKIDKFENNEDVQPEKSPEEEFDEQEEKQ